MIHYLIINESHEGLTLSLADQFPTDKQIILCEVSRIKTGSFHNLWQIIKEREEILQKVATATEKDCIPFHLIKNEDMKVIEYDTSQINKLISLFTLIKAWTEFQGCNGFDLKKLY